MNTVAVTKSRLASGRRNKQAGAGLIELLLGIIIVSLIIVGLYQLYKGNSNDVKAQGMQQSAVTLAASVSRMYGGANNYTGLTTGVIARSGIVPANLTIAGTAPNQTISHAWGGLVTVNPASSVGATPGDSRFFAVDFVGVEREACVGFVSGIVGNAAAVFVGATLPATAPTGATIVKPFQGTLDAANLAAGCGAANVVSVRAVYQ